MKRILTALVLVPLAVYSVLFSPPQLFLAVIAIVAVLCFREYARLTDAYVVPGYVAGLLILIAPLNQAALILFLTALAAVCLPMASPQDLAKGTSRAAALVLGVAYIFGAWKMAALLRENDTVHLRYLTTGRHWLMFALMVNWIGDTGAYYVGRKFGKHKLAPRVSPGKSWEGAIASAVTSLIFGLIYIPLAIPGTPWWIAAAISLAANAAGQIGDLAESALKRGAGMKDSGTMLPGHGGVLDRVDSSLFAVPVVYTLVMLSTGSRP